MYLHTKPIMHRSRACEFRPLSRRAYPSATQSRTLKKISAHAQSTPHSAVSPPHIPPRKPPLSRFYSDLHSTLAMKDRPAKRTRRPPPSSPAEDEDAAAAAATAAQDALRRHFEERFGALEDVAPVTAPAPGKQRKEVIDDGSGEEDDDDEGEEGEGEDGDGDDSGEDSDEHVGVVEVFHGGNQRKTGPLSKREKRAFMVRISHSMGREREREREREEGGLLTDPTVLETTLTPTPRDDHSTARRRPYQIVGREG